MSTTENTKATNKATKNEGKKKPGHDAPLKRELLVIVAKDTKGATRSVNALDVAPVTTVAIVSAGREKANLCLNLLADNVDKTIRDAIDSRGGIARLFNGKISDPEISAMKRIVAVAADIRVAAWKAFTLTAKRVRTISLQGLAKAIAAYQKPAGDKKEEPVKLRPLLVAWCKDHDTGELPASLYDILVNANIIAEEEEPEPETTKATKATKRK